MYQSTEPARYWQQQLAEWGPKVLFAILILIVTHFVAKAVQWGVAKMIDRVPVLKRHPDAGGDSHASADHDDPAHVVSAPRADLYTLADQYGNTVTLCHCEDA